MLRKNYSEDQAQVNIIIILELVEPKKVSFFLFLLVGIILRYHNFSRNAKDILLRSFDCLPRIPTIILALFYYSIIFWSLILVTVQHTTPVRIIDTIWNLLFVAGAIRRLRIYFGLIIFQYILKLLTRLC